MHELPALAGARGRSKVFSPMMDGIHKNVIGIGIAVITCGLLSLLVIHNKQPVSFRTSGQALGGSAFLTPTRNPSPGAKVLSVGDRATPTVSQVSPVVSPDTRPTSSPTPRVTLSPLPTASAYATPGITPKPSPTATPWATVSVTPSPTSSPTPTATPPTPLSPVVINEVAWMGTAAEPSDEWIELYNPNDAPVDVAGWTMVSTTDATFHLVLKGSISARGYYLIERTDDKPVSDIPADLIGSFGNGIKDPGWQISLKDAQGNTQDSLDCSGGWYAGSKATRASMERISADISGSTASSWATNNGTIRNGIDADGSPIQGTPRSKNSVSP